MADSKISASNDLLTDEIKTYEKRDDILDTNNPVISMEHSAAQACELGKKVYGGSYERLDESNKGYKLLMRMGWSGSGRVGRNEDGIADPVVAVPTRNRGGIGLVVDVEPKKKKWKLYKETGPKQKNKRTKEMDSKIKEERKERKQERITRVGDMSEEGRFRIAEEPAIIGRAERTEASSGGSIQNSMSSSKHLHEKSVLIPNFTLHVLSACEIKDSYINLFVKVIGGVSVMSIVESCKCNNMKFEFQFKRSEISSERYEVELLINGVFVILGGGITFGEARLDAATKGIELLKDKQPVINKSINDVFLQQNEVIPGLLLSYEELIKKDFWYEYDVITRSCRKCGLDIDWYQIEPMCLIPTERTYFILTIQSKIVYIINCDRRETYRCAQQALTRLQVHHEGDTGLTIEENSSRMDKTLTEDHKVSKYKSEDGHIPLEKGETINGLTIYFNTENFTNSVMIIRDSCRKCNLKVKTINCRKGEKHFVTHCFLFVIGDRCISKGFGVCGKQARSDAGKRAIAILLENGQRVDYETDLISKSTILDAINHTISISMLQKSVQELK